MKTIRTNCFETNSSSTHAYSVSAPSDLSIKPMQTFVTEDGVVKVNLSTGEPSDSMLGKLSFLLSVAYYIGNQTAFDRVVKVAEDFAKIKLDVQGRIVKDGKYVWDTITTVLPVEEDEDERNDALNDTFYSWTNEYGHDGVDSFIEEVEKIWASEQSILVFVFSNLSPFHTESYYS